MCYTELLLYDGFITSIEVRQKPKRTFACQYIYIYQYIFLNRSKYNISYTLNTFFIISFNTWFTNPVFSTYIVHLVYEYIYARFFRVSICSWFHFLLDWILWFLKQVLVDAVVQEKPLNDLWKILQVNFRGIF